MLTTNLNTEGQHMRYGGSPCLMVMGIFMTEVGNIINHKTAFNSLFTFSETFHSTHPLISPHAPGHPVQHVFMNYILKTALSQSNIQLIMSMYSFYFTLSEHITLMLHTV